MITESRHSPSCTLEDIGGGKFQKLRDAQLSSGKSAPGGVALLTATLLGLAPCHAGDSAGAAGVPKPSLFVSHQKQVNLVALSPFSVIVLDPSCAFEKRVLPPDQRVLARIDAGKVTADDEGGWIREIEQRFVAPALAHGFTGVAVDGLTEAATHKAIALLEKLRRERPQTDVVMCNPPPSIDASAAKTNGILFDGVYSGRSAGKPAVEAYRVQALAMAGVPVYVVEFAAGAKPEQASRLAERVALLGAVPFVTTAGCDGASLAPLRDHSRRVLVVFGWDPKEAEKPPTWPVDTMVADLLQTPLEWLGFEADYLDIGKKSLPTDLAPYAAVVLDGELDVPLARETETVRWLASAKESGVPVLFVGGIPFASDQARQMLAAKLDLKGSLRPVPQIGKVAVARVDKTIASEETELVARVNDFTDLTAPDNSQVLVSLRGRGPDGALLHFDPVFLTEWGGMWLEPYIVFRGSADNSLFYADPYRMLAAFFSKQGTIPAPDTTTRDGRRLFYSHIDGDGFATPSDFRGHPLCGELVRDRVLKVFPFPVTASVIEADMRTLAEGLEDSARDRIKAAARSIFSLPHIEAASHSFSHPYQWDADDPNPGIYDEPNMPLKPAAQYSKIDVEREIRGSVDYINQNLLPDGKKVELMLWSGNCRPGVRALQVCRELGIENMNGGNTIISRLYPGIAGIAPRVMPWGDELQIHAANQNEFMYANGWQGPFYGGFADVIDTFERTETGRRTKPVNVYYHFYSATSLSSLRALEKIHQWCLAQDMHSVTALQYARIVKDAWRTRVYEVGPRHWLLANEGDLRTFRLPGYLGRPDLAQCRGVTGWTEHHDSIYIHTRGQPVTELVLVDEPSGPVTAKTARLRLASCTAEIRFSEFDSLKVAFSVRDLRPVTAEFAGLQPKAVCEVTINAAASRATADPAGHLKLSLPPSAEVILDATRSRYASLR